jgi:hypothetical protein
VQFSDWAGSSQNCIEPISLVKRVSIHGLNRVQVRSGLIVRLNATQVGRNELATCNLATFESSLDLIYRGFHDINVRSTSSRCGRLSSKTPRYVNRGTNV